MIYSTKKSTNQSLLFDFDPCCVWQQRVLAHRCVRHIWNRSLNNYESNPMLEFRRYASWRFRVKRKMRFKRFLLLCFLGLSLMCFTATLLLPRIKENNLIRFPSDTFSRYAEFLHRNISLSNGWVNLKSDYFVEIVKPAKRRWLVGVLLCWTRVIPVKATHRWMHRNLRKCLDLYNNNPLETVKYI